MGRIIICGQDVLKAGIDGPSGSNMFLHNGLNGLGLSPYSCNGTALNRGLSFTLRWTLWSQREQNHAQHKSTPAIQDRTALDEFEQSSSAFYWTEACDTFWRYSNIIEIETGLYRDYTVYWNDWHLADKCIHNNSICSINALQSRLQRKTRHSFEMRRVFVKFGSDSKENPHSKRRDVVRGPCSFLLLFLNPWPWGHILARGLEDGPYGIAEH